MHDPNSPEGMLAKVIWEASHNDEGTISALGADIVASAIWRKLERGELKLPTTEQPSCSHCGGNYPKGSWPGNQYNGHWDTCPNRPCGATTPLGYCILPRDHQFNATGPGGHMARQGVPEPESWDITPGQIIALPPDPLERIADALENIGPTIANAVSEAIVWNENRR